MVPASKQNHFPTRVVAEVGLMLAAFAVLDIVAVRLPINVAGGSISLAMAPIAVYALVRGWRLGILLGALAGALDMLISPYFVHPVQMVLDYPVAYAAVGLAGLLAPAVRAALARGGRSRTVALVATAVAVGATARLLAHWVSGVVFFGSFAPAGQPVWLYSLVYNASYIWPSAVASAIVAAAVTGPVARAVLGPEQPQGEWE